MKAGVTVAMQLGTRAVQIIGPAAERPFGADGVVRLTEAPLDRLHARGRLDETDRDRNTQLFNAGDRLRRHDYLAGLSGFASNDLSGRGGSNPAMRTSITETMEANRRALDRARATMHVDVWTTLRAVVCSELTLLKAGYEAGFAHKNAATAVALDRVRIGLRALAELWGFSPPDRPHVRLPPAANDTEASRAA